VLSRGAWMAQSAKRPTLDLSSGRDLRVVSLSPALGSMLGGEPTKVAHLVNIGVALLSLFPQVDCDFREGRFPLWHSRCCIPRAEPLHRAHWG